MYTEDFHMTAQHRYTPPTKGLSLRLTLRLLSTGGFVRGSSFEVPLLQNTAVTAAFVPRSVLLVRKGAIGSVLAPSSEDTLAHKRLIAMQLGPIWHCMRWDTAVSFMSKERNSDVV